MLPGAPPRTTNVQNVATMPQATITPSFQGIVLVQFRFVQIYTLERNFQPNGVNKHQTIKIVGITQVAHRKRGK
jgi:hypothetical protein